MMCTEGGSRNRVGATGWPLRLVVQLASERDYDILVRDVRSLPAHPEISDFTEDREKLRFEVEVRGLPAYCGVVQVLRQSQYDQAEDRRVAGPIGFRRDSDPEGSETILNHDIEHHCAEQRTDANLAVQREVGQFFSRIINS